MRGSEYTSGKMDETKSTEKHVSWRQRFSIKRPSKVVKIDMREDGIKQENVEREEVERARLSIECVCNNYKLWTRDDLEREIGQLQDERTRRIFEACVRDDVKALEKEVEDVGDKFGSVRDSKGRSPLHVASYFGYNDVIRCVLKYGVSVDELDSCTSLSAIDYASAGGHRSTVSILLSEGATINYKPSLRKLPLHWAVSSGQVSCVHELLLADSSTVGSLSPQPESLSPLLLATAFGFDEIVEYLLQHGADATGVQPKSLDSGLHIAALVGNVKCAELFLEKNVSLHCRNARGETALHLSRWPEITRLLIERGTVVDVVDVDGRTPLHSAVFEGTFPKIEVLISNGANMNVQDKNGDTCLHLAIKNGAAKIACFLLSQGANAAITNNGDQSALSLMQSKMPHLTDHINYTMNRGIKVAANDPIDIDCTLELDFSYIGMIPKPLHENRRSKVLARTPSYAARLLEGSKFLRNETHFVGTIVDGGNKHILVHPLIEAFLEIKWSRMRHIFYANFIFYVIMALLYTFFIMEKYMKLCPTSDEAQRSPNVSGVMSRSSPERQSSSWNWFFPSRGSEPPPTRLFEETQINDSTTMMPVLTGTTTFGTNSMNELPAAKQCSAMVWSTTVAWYILILATFLATIKEMAKLVQCFKKSLSAVETWGQILVLACIWLTCWWDPSVPCDCSKVKKWQYSFAALGILLSWSMLLVRIGKFPKYGIYVQMLGKVLINFGRFTLVYFTILNAFALTFCVVLPREPPFATYIQSMLKIFTMMVGELDYEDMFYEKSPQGPEPVGRFSFVMTKDLDYPLQTHILYCVFVAVISISLMNLLVGLAVSDIQSLEEKATVDRLHRQAQSIVQLENFLFCSAARKVITKYLFAELKMKLLVQPLTNRCKFTVRPNDPADPWICEKLKCKLLHIACPNLHTACGNDKALPVTRAQGSNSDFLEHKEENRSKAQSLEQTVEEIRAQVELLSRLLQQKLAQSEGGQSSRQ